MTFKLPKAERRAAAGGADISAARLTLSLSGTNLERAGDYNQRIVLQAIRLMDETTRSELARVTGLTAPTIANITAKLTDLGFVKPAGRLQGKRGQPAMRIVINPDGAFSIGLNIDRDHITLVTLDLAGQVRSRKSREVAFALPETVIDYVRESLPALLKEGDVDRNRILGVGVALPDDMGRISLPHRPPEYDQWSDTEIGDLLGDVLPWPIYTDNDAASAAQGEAHLGNGLAVTSFFYLLVSAGLGSGLVIDRAYVRGADSRSGEIWAMPDPVHGPGHNVQDTVSLSALYDRLEQAGHRVECPNSLVDGSPERQAVVDDWLDDAAEVLVQPLIAVNCLINPATILIGGRLPGKLADALVERLNARMADCAIPAVAPVRRADTADDASAIGAALMPFLDSVLPSESILMQAGR
ncbi:ROK family transcriptional regulator [Stakelama pacifica]|uniref:MarR family transcriptional regulator n=1 Tax=Stakelama pacifica TaxID=517720 RepID=A0A4R6FUQ4_9SPHN|nr:ROK family transcriptional regulator [Stakelama pacifica]TDN85541.1 MarR family transcriptional regulator [Stakelama pacifica]GGO92343.1 sugar kinase [Stakelama pacifica]